MRPALVLAGAVLAAAAASETKELRLIEVDPAHSHAAALHATMLPGFSPEAHVYAPLGPELAAHLNRVAQFNSRASDPTRWTLSVYAGPDYLARMRQEAPGNVVVLSGRNQQAISYIEASLQAGQNVLADKPWIIEAENLPRLEAALALASGRGLIAYDCMTQRFDTAYQLQRTLVADRALFGDAVPGTAAEPSVRMRNLHALYKKPSLRPAWFFDVRQQGEGIADVGTHLVDLVEWTLFPDQALDYRRDARVLSATRSPVILTRSQFEQVTAEPAWPGYLRDAVEDDRLSYYANSDAIFAVRGIHVQISVKWEFEAKAGEKDSYFASYQGSKARVELRQGSAEKFTPEIYIIPVSRDSQFLQQLKSRYPGYKFEEDNGSIHMLIEQGRRVPDDRHFALLAERFLRYVKKTEPLPAWERPNMIAKYYITTRAVELARQTSK